MNRTNKPIFRLLVLCLSIVMILGACAPKRVTLIPTKGASLRLEDGSVKALDEKNNWVPVGAETTFELVGELESTEPWMVNGNTFAVRDFTQITEGLRAGDLVRVKGLILADGTWLANSITRAEEQIDPTIVLIGKMDSVDPWVIHGITLDVTEDTTIVGEIVPGTVVNVAILLHSDGTWEVLSIAPLSGFTEIPGCATVTATVLSMDGDTVQFAGWPAITVNKEVHIEDETGKEMTLSPNQMVLAVICATEDDLVTITKIIVLRTGIGDPSVNGEKVLVCHKPDKKGGHTLSIAASAVSAHLAHGDKLGPCP